MVNNHLLSRVHVLQFPEENWQMRSGPMHCFFKILDKDVSEKEEFILTHHSSPLCRGSCGRKSLRQLVTWYPNSGSRERLMLVFHLL